jgi:hypothetical protein
LISHPLAYRPHDEDQLYELTLIPPPAIEFGRLDPTAVRLAQLPTRKEMYHAVLLGVTAGACLVQCLAWLFRFYPMEILWSLTVIGSPLAIVFIITRD